MIFWRVVKLVSIFIIVFSLVLCSVVVYDADGDPSMDPASFINVPFFPDHFISDVLSILGAVIPFESVLHIPESISLSFEMHQKSPPLVQNFSFGSL